MDGEEGALRRRTWMLAALGAAAGLAGHWLTDGAWDSAWRTAAAAFVAVSAFAFAVVVVPAAWRAGALFALGCGAVAGLVTWNSGMASGPDGEGWRFVAAALALFIAAPLFQSARDSGRWRADHPGVYRHAWTNLILWSGAWLFALLIWLFAHMLGALFDLIGIDLIRRLLDRPEAAAPLIGGALGAAIGLLRAQENVVDTTHRLVTAVLAVLAPPLALALLLFVAALPFTGLAPLFAQTRAPTPILLSAVIGAVVLIVAVIGEGRETDERAPLLRWSAAALAALVLPLALVAAVATGLRIGQHGLMPERIWAAIFVGVAIAFGLAYLWALARGRRDWPAAMRAMHLRLAAGLCLLALVLALPILDFNALSVRSQVARLEAGAVAPEAFDWRALRHDLGAPGRRALARLAAHGDPQIGRLAAAAQRGTWPVQQVRPPAADRAILVRPEPVPVPDGLRAALFGAPAGDFHPACAAPGACTLFWKPGEDEAVAVLDPCADAEARCALQLTPLAERDGRWRPVRHPGPSPSDADLRRAVAAGKVEIGERVVRQVRVGGRPVGPVFE